MSRTLPWRADAVAPLAAFVVFALVPLWRIGAPLWYDEVLYPMVASGDLSLLQTYVMCNGSLWEAILFSWWPPPWISPWVVRLPQVLAMAAAGALLVAHVRGVRSRAALACFWLLYMPVAYYACEGRQFGLLTLGVAIAAIGVDRRSLRWTVGGGAFAATVSPYGALLLLLALVFGLTSVPPRRRLPAIVATLSVLGVMATVFPHLPLNYPPRLRRIIMPETNPDFSFTFSTTAAQWLVGSEHLALFVPLLAAWLGLMWVYRRSRLAWVAAAIVAGQMAILVATPRLMHLWNMFSWAPFFALILAAAAGATTRVRVAAWAIVAALLANALLTPELWLYRGAKPVLGVDTHAWRAAVGAHPDADVVLPESGPIFPVFWPVIPDIPQSRIYVDGSPYALAPAMVAGAPDWIRPDQAFVPLDTVPPDERRTWLVLLWDMELGNPCAKIGNPCIAHFQPQATIDAPPSVHVPGDITRTFRGGQLVRLEATAADVQALLARHEPLRGTERVLEEYFQHRRREGRRFLP